MAARAVRLFHPLLHDRRHDIPGGQVAERVPAGDDRPARRVDEHRARAAQRLGDQRALAAGRILPQDGRVELHELHAAQRGTGPGGERQAVTGQPGRVGGGRVGLAEAAGSHDHRARRDGADLQHPVVSGDPGQHPADRAPVAGQRVQGDAPGQDLDPAGQQGCAEHPVHFPADRVTPGVHDPLPAVPALQVQRGPLQPGPQGGQAVDLTGGLRHQRRDGRRITQAGPASIVSC